MSPVRVLVAGAGGHARVCIESLGDSGHEVVGVVSRDGTPVAGLSVDVLGTDDLIWPLMNEHGAEAVFVAVGDNAQRAEVMRRCDVMGLRCVNAVNRYAMVSPTALLAEGVAVMAAAVVNAGATVGRGVVVNTGARVDHDCVLGAFVHVAPGAVLAGGVSVGAGALVGVGAAVLPNVSIGEGAVIGGGATVVRAVPAGAVVVGTPARPMATRRDG